MPITNEQIAVEIIKLLFNDKFVPALKIKAKPMEIPNVRNPKNKVYKIAAQLLLPNPK